MKTADENEAFLHIHKRMNQIRFMIRDTLKLYVSLDYYYKFY